MKTLLVGTTNRNKLAELREVAKHFSYELLSLADHQAQRGLSSPPDVAETGSSYRENAFLKAKAYAEWSGVPVVVDDSGLEVLVLNREPGVHSAEYLGKDVESETRMRDLARRIKEFETSHPDLPHSETRACEFVCTLVYCDLTQPKEQILEATYRLQGELLDAPRGNQGFGYDPIVFIPELGCTYAELDFADKAAVGFRARAGKILFEKLSLLTR